MGLLVKLGTFLTFLALANAVCTRFPLKVERKADGSLESFCEYKAPNSPTAVKIIRGLKIQSQKCISCECTSMGLICCREDKPDSSTVPQGCMVVPERCGYKMVLIHDRNVECLPLHMTGGTATPIKHVMKTMSTGKYESVSSSAAEKKTIKVVVTESPKPHSPKHSASAHSSTGSGSGSSSGNNAVNMADIASTISKYMQKLHKENVAKSTTSPRPKTTTAKPDSMIDMMAMQSFIDGGGLNQFGGLEGLMRMNALGGGSLFGGPTTPAPAPKKSNSNSNSNSNNLLDDYLTMKAMTESGALAGMGGLAGMASMAGMAGMGGMGAMGMIG